jgi:hypothetical protein
MSDVVPVQRCCESHSDWNVLTLHLTPERHTHRPLADLDPDPARTRSGT